MLATIRSLVVATICTASFLPSAGVHGDLITNPPITVTRVVTVNPVILSNNDGSNTAEFLGDAFQQADIEGYINEIWAQAGIQINFQAPAYWDNTFANVGTASPRPVTDLDTIVSNASGAGFIDPDPNVMNIFFVEIAAGFIDTGEWSVNGLAYIGGNGITMHVGDNLVSIKPGQEIVASVVAHEIGHNLGLSHIVEAENLMQEGGAPSPGERLSSAQVSIALSSNFAQAVPEPASALALLGLTGLIAIRHRRRRAA